MVSASGRQRDGVESAWSGAAIIEAVRSRTSISDDGGSRAARSVALLQPLLSGRARLRASLLDLFVALLGGRARVVVRGLLGLHAVRLFDVLLPLALLGLDPRLVRRVRRQERQPVA